MILYYSGTGNSRYAASVIARETGDELVCINDILRERAASPYTARYAFSSDAPFVFVSPTYCYRVPRVVEKFIRDSRFEGSRKAYFFLTCGSGTGAAAQEAEKLCRETELEFMGLGSVVMPENYITLFEAPTYDEALAILRAAHSQIESAGRLIRYGRTLEDANGGSGLKALPTRLNSLFYKHFVNDKKYTVGDNCIGCGQCARVCPLANIRMVDSKPRWNGNCTQCMACIGICPQDAIEYGSRSKGKRRYYLYADGRQKQ